VSTICSGLLIFCLSVLCFVHCNVYVFVKVFVIGEVLYLYNYIESSVAPPLASLHYLFYIPSKTCPNAFCLCHAPIMLRTPYHTKKIIVCGYTCTYSYAGPYGQARLVAPTVLPAGPPPLLPEVTVKLGLAQLPIHCIVGAAQPFPEVVTARSADLLLLHIFLEVLGAHPARVQLGER
jgi:hypothetical protein